ncbi:SH3 domain-containing protein [Clostridium sp. HCP1S3_B4]|uniref:C40 family peptidase n=1 Tax=unclassified Clostridium TaxID=2614128 RepID=UPI003F8BE73A
MNRKKIMKIVVASTLVVGGVTLNDKSALADEVFKESAETKTADSDKQDEVSSKKNDDSLKVTEDKTEVEEAAAKSTQKGKIVNVTTNLRIRSQASTSSSILGYLLNNTEVSVISQSGDFYKITYRSITGYVHKDYVKIISQNNSSAENLTSSSGVVVNVSTSLNVRSGPGTSYGIIGHLKNGQGVTITGENGAFYAISYNGTKGYVSKDYVSKGSTSGNQSGSNSSILGTVVNVSTNLRVRSAASTSSSVLGYLLNGQKVTITGENGNFYAINFNGQTAYVSKDYISKGSSSSSSGNSITNKTGIVTASVLNIRSGASTSNSIIGTLSRGSSVTITGESGGFYKINYNGQNAYVSKDYIQIGGGSSLSQSDKYSAVLSNMKSQLGVPYCWGGYGQLLTTASLRTLKATFPTQAANGAYSRVESYVNKGYRAFDCSGLMQWGFGNAGISLGRTTWDQIKNGYEVSLNNLKPGDLLFYSNLQHVGMYIGNGQWIEAPNKNANIRITNVPWNLVGRARRVL